jgi:hypothetical protein
MAEKLTRQGVRNLDHIKGPSTGRRLPLPPDTTKVCLHPRNALRQSMETGLSICGRCGQVLDDYGDPF